MNLRQRKVLLPGAALLLGEGKSVLSARQWAGTWSLVLVLTTLSEASGSGAAQEYEAMLSQREAFGREFLPTLNQYTDFREAAFVYKKAIRGINSLWRSLGHRSRFYLDDLASAYVEAMQRHIAARRLTNEEALSRLQLMEQMIVEDYARYVKQGPEGRRDPMAFWALWKERLAVEDRQEPVACFQAGLTLMCH